jgi:hypothetical protein
MRDDREGEPEKPGNAHPPIGRPIEVRGYLREVAGGQSPYDEDRKE